MNKTLATVAAFAAVLLIVGCATKIDPPVQYDFGSLPPAATAAALPPISLADVNAPAWLDNNMMFFRLAYANQQQPRPYAGSRWTMPPAQLFQQRLKSRLAQAGGTVLALSDAALNMPVLRIDMDDFTQTFDTPSHSVSQLTVRASLFNGRLLLAQKTFSRQAETPSADAAGAARAFATVNDAVIDDMMRWLANVPVKK